MADIVSREQRSRMMGRIGGKDTGPELSVRRILRSLRVGYRLHVSGLPGHPDIVMKGRQKIIEVRGCFWHRHPGCPKAYTPKSNKAFWKSKFTRNVARDRKNARELQNSGWDVLTVWECETSDTKLLSVRVRKFLSDRGKPA